MPAPTTAGVVRARAPTDPKLVFPEGMLMQTIARGKLVALGGRREGAADARRACQAGAQDARRGASRTLRSRARRGQVRPPRRAPVPLHQSYKRLMPCGHMEVRFYLRVTFRWCRASWRSPRQSQVRVNRRLMLLAMCHLSCMIASPFRVTKHLFSLLLNCYSKREG